MNRRRFLASSSALGLSIGVTGCLGGLGAGDSNPGVVLAEPDRPYESGDVSYPAWGQQLPDVTLPTAPGSGETRLRETERPVLVTFFYSHCQTVCPVLISALRNVQAHAQNNGYSDEIGIFPVTFDPERDTTRRLRTYADEMNVDIDDDSWQFLRPASPDRATAVVADQFGVGFERTEPEDMDMYMFNHTALTLLANDGLVERAYQTDSPDEETIIEDLTAVREA